MDAISSEEESGKVSREAALWAMRLFVGRDPRDEEELEFHRGNPDIETLRRAFALTAEFNEFYTKLTKPPFTVPLFLVTPPTSLAYDWRSTPPTLSDPVSQLCTEWQFREPVYQSICEALDLPFPVLHRKFWEYVWIVAILEKEGLLREGVKGLGFGVGSEPLPAFFARKGMDVLATDAPAEIIQGHGWDTTGQHAQTLSAMRRPAIVDDAILADRVKFRPVDMNNIPAELVDFDFCWSACCFEHLGSIDHGLKFVENSLATLKPGGLAIHTTEFCLSSNTSTFEHETLSLFRKQDIERLLNRLAQLGHNVWPMNFHPGTGASDEHIDLPPYALPHLKLKVAGFVTTSIGIVVQKSLRR